MLMRQSDQWEEACSEITCGLWVGRSRFLKKEIREPSSLRPASELASVWKMRKEQIVAELRSYGVACHDRWTLPEVRTMLQDRADQEVPVPGLPGDASTEAHPRRTYIALLRTNSGGGCSRWALEGSWASKSGGPQLLLLCSSSDSQAPLLFVALMLC